MLELHTANAVWSADRSFKISKSNSDSWSRLQSVFEQALELPQDERSEFVSGAAGDDETLVEEVLSLLAAHDDADDVLEVPPIAVIQDTRADPSPPAGRDVSGYELLDEIHRGGQGVVYRAIQLSTKREVAVKLMLAGALAGDVSKRRFQREVELVCGLKHPNIVPIFDSGLANDQYYYAMEFIDGLRMDLFVRHRELGHRDVLALVARVCDAVYAAHEAGVVHRDLKPSNILVDKDGDPHVLDFGLAKGGIDHQETVTLSMTGQVMGTLAYMSPEQASGRPNDVDARSDVYSMGVILYELLTEKLPYELDFALAENLTAIRDAEPDRSILRECRIDNEVSTILLKSLSKEQERRYQNAGELRDDIQRYLRGEPIEAKKDSTFYVLRKSARRYVMQAAIAGTLVLGIAIGVLVSQGPTGPPGIPPFPPPLEEGERYDSEVLTDQVRAIEEMLKQDYEHGKIIDELIARFDMLAESKFDDSLTERDRFDLDSMKSLADFIDDEPSLEDVWEFREEDWPGDQPEASGPVNDVVPAILELLEKDFEEAEDGEAEEDDEDEAPE